jgi:acyl-CoA oxidase
LTLQAGRYLIGCYREAKSGKAQTGGVSYLNRLSSLLNSSCNATKPTELLKFDIIEEAYNVVSGNIVKKAGEYFEEGIKNGMSEDESYEHCCKKIFLNFLAQIRLYAAKMHSYGYLFNRFKDAVVKAPSSLRPILAQLCQLYGLYNIAENCGAFLQYKYFNSTQVFIYLVQKIDGLD